MKAFKKKQEQLNVMNFKFQKLFGANFDGHKQYLMKKVGAMHQNTLHLLQKGESQYAEDFQDVI